MDIESVKTLAVKPGEILVVKLPHGASTELWNSVIRDFSNYFGPKGADVIVIEHGMELSTISIDKEVKRMVKEEVERILDERASNEAEGNESW